MDRRTLRIYDRIGGKMRYEDWYMDEYDSKEQFADMIREFAIGAYEIVMDNKPEDEDDTTD